MKFNIEFELTDVTNTFRLHKLSFPTYYLRKIWIDSLNRANIYGKLNIKRVWNED